MASHTSIRESAGDRWFIAGVYVFLSLILLAVLYPLVYIVSSSFSSTKAVVAGEVWLLPVEPTLMGYKAVFNNPHIMTGFFNSLFYAVFGTMFNVAMTVMAGYVLSRKGLYGRNAMMVLFVFTMLFSGGLIPTYMVVNSIGLVDTRLAMIIPSALAVWQVIITRTFFQATIPQELSEAGELDGCSDINFLLRVALPLSKPIIAVLVLMYAVSHWNAYFDALIYLKTAKLFPLQIILRDILIMNTLDPLMMSNVKELAQRQGLQNLLKYSLIVVSSGPVLLIYPFVQKYFVKGVMIGSLKG